MKKILLCALVFNQLIATAQQTLTLQPGPTDGKDATISSRSPTGPVEGGNYPEFDLLAWTNQGNAATYRSLIDFDLTQIPEGSEIISATLYLYYLPGASNQGHSNLSGSNDGVIRRITAPWNETTVSWNAQPSTSNANQTQIPASTATNQNYEISITELVQDYVDNPTTSHGFLLKLNVESYYRSLIFASSDNTNASLRPKLVVTYNSALGVEAADFANLIQVYPNPSNDVIAIQAPMNYTYEIFTLTGTKVAEHTAVVTSKEHTLSIADFAKGSYLIAIKLENGAVVKKNIFVN